MDKSRSFLQYNTMAEAVSYKTISCSENCVICTGNQINPKTLTCQHFFCKDCLDELVTFREDGSALISCPYTSCSVKTFLSADQVVNDLKDNDTNVQNNLYELDKDELANAFKCTYVTECSNAAFIHCCGIKMCKSCSSDHTVKEKEHERRVQLYFCRKDKTMKGLCEVHSSVFTHVCSCSIFLCKYCVVRNENHKNHEKKPIKDEVASIKKVLIEEIKKREAHRKATEERLPQMQANLDAILEARKEECIRQYKAYLTSEEEKIKKKFDDICGNITRLANMSL